MKWISQKIVDDTRLPLVFIKFAEDEDGKFSVWEDTWSYMDKNLPLFDVSGHIVGAMLNSALDKEVEYE